MLSTSLPSLSYPYLQTPLPLIIIFSLLLVRNLLTSSSPICFPKLSYDVVLSQINPDSSTPFEHLDTTLISFKLVQSPTPPETARMLSPITAARGRYWNTDSIDFHASSFPYLSQTSSKNPLSMESCLVSCAPRRRDTLSGHFTLREKRRRMVSRLKFPQLMQLPRNKQLDGDWSLMIYRRSKY